MFNIKPIWNVIICIINNGIINSTYNDLSCIFMNFNHVDRIGL